LQFIERITQDSVQVHLNRLREVCATSKFLNATVVYAAKT
jgi:hypothetical protein